MARRTIRIDRGWRKISGAALGLNGRAVKVGIMAGSGSHDGTSLVDIAVFNEFGTERIPSRPFMRRTADENEGRVQRFAAGLARRVMSGQMRPEQLLDSVGLWFQRAIRATIRNSPSWAVPNAPSTIARKGSTKPLVDTGLLHGSVNYEKTRL
jgi:hypothetical protein